MQLIYDVKSQYLEKKRLAVVALYSKMTRWSREIVKSAASE